jgi:hypothetical protein
MSKSEAEEVLANWVKQAVSGPGQLVEGLKPSEWVARQFLKWWQAQGVVQPWKDARAAAERITSELERLGGWKNADLGEAMHELIHLNEAIAEIGETLGLTAAD